MKGIKRTIRLLCVAGLACLPFCAAAHLLDGSPDPLPRWVPIAGLIIAGVMGGIVGFAINKHRQSMERLKKQRQQRAADAAKSAAEHSVTNPAPPESAP
jgi:protein-S-isoprenylcysteine O-methyltransferase Ste14